MESSTYMHFISYVEWYGMEIYIFIYFFLNQFNALKPTGLTISPPMFSL